MSYVQEIERSVKRYEPGHKHALRAFQRAQFETRRQADDEFCEWLFERNPHRDRRGPPLWICERDGVVVGQQGSLPVVLKIGDLEQRAAWIIDWMIHPEWRLRGVAPALAHANMSDWDLMLGLGLEGNAHKTLQRLGWQEIGFLSLFVRPFDPEGSARILRLPPLAGKAVPRALLGGSARAAGRIAAATSRLAMEQIPAFDERVEKIWNTAKRDYPILAKRDFATVSWRYDDGPYKHLVDRYYFTRRGEPIGYAVVRVTSWRGYRIGRVVDYLAPRKSIGPLLALTLEALYRQQVLAAFLEQWHPGTEMLLASLGCIRARPSHRFMFKLRDPGSPLAAALAHAANWYLTPGDADFDLVLIDTQSQE